MDRLKLVSVFYAGVDGSRAIAEHVQGPLDGATEEVFLSAGQTVSTPHGPADVVIVHGGRIGVVFPQTEERRAMFLQPGEVVLELDSAPGIVR